MKNLLVCLVAFGLAYSLNAQNGYQILSKEVGTTSNPGSRTIVCPPGSIYSHEVNYFNGISSMDQHFKWWDQVESAPGAPISLVVFFGSVDTIPDRNFTISFYHDNGGIPGTVIASYTGFIIGVNTGEILFDRETFTYTYNLPVDLTLNAGDWVSVVAENSIYPWYWLTGTPGDGCIYNNLVGTMCDIGDLAFCLIGGPGGSEVPVAPWALAIGITLIGAVVILRYRRIQ
jgi:hypothetical protein